MFNLSDGTGRCGGEPFESGLMNGGIWRENHFTLEPVSDNSVSSAPQLDGR